MSSRGAARGTLIVILLLVLAAIASAVLWLYHKKKVEAEAEDAAFSAAASTGMIAASLDTLPADAWAFLTIPDLTGYGAGFSRSALGRMLADPELTARARQALADLGEGEGAKELDSALAGIEDIAGLGLRSLAVAVFPLPAAEPGTKGEVGGGAILACDDPQRVARWIDEKIAGDPPAAGEPAAAPVTGTFEGLSFTCHEDLCRAVRANALLLGAPREAFERLVRGGGEPLPSSSARVQQAIELTQAKSSGVFLFLDLHQVVSEVRTAVAGDEKTRRTFEVLGAAALDHFAYSQTVDGDVFLERGVFAHDTVVTGLLPELLAVPAAELSFDRFLPADADTAFVARLPDLARLFDRILAELRPRLEPEDLAQLDQALLLAKAQFGLDLRDDLLAVIGEELGVATAMPAEAPLSPALALEKLRVHVVLAVRDASRLEALLGRLEALAGAVGARVRTEPLADGKLRTIALPAAGGASPMVALAAGKLVIGTDPAAVQGSIDGSIASLAADPAYGALRALFPREATGVSYSRDPGKPLRQVVRTASLAAGEADRARLESSVTAMEELAQAIESYRGEYQGAHPVAADLHGLAPHLIPRFLAALPGQDGWGHDLHYLGTDQGFVLWSLGADAAAERDWSGCVTGCAEAMQPVATPKDDLVIANGTRLRWPVRGADGRLDVTGLAPPPSLTAFIAALDTHLQALPPAMAVARTAAPGRIEIEARGPLASVALPGMLALGAAPRLLSSVGAGKQQRTMSDLRAIGIAAEAHAVDHGGPPPAASLEELAPIVEPTYLRALPRSDAWGTPYFYRSDGRAYVVASAGRDGKFEQDWSRCLQGCADAASAGGGPDQDIVFTDGAFLRQPAGAD